MHKTRPAEITSPIVSLNGGHLKAVPLALIVAAIGIGGALFLSYTAAPDLWLKRFLHTYLASFCFILSIGVGCLFFVTIMHLTRAGWSTTLRRIAELYAMCLLPMFILFLPILVLVLSGSDVVYSWNAGGYSEMHDMAKRAAMSDLPVKELPPIEQLKHAFLNPTFFTIRICAYFAIWGLLAYTYLSQSLKQDETGDGKITARLQGLSAPFLILFAVTVVFASFDIEMTLSPLWFSTMFPVYFFAGAFLSANCVILLTCLYLQKTGRITDEVTIEHYHDLGKLMQGFVIFWGYIAFSQFLLIWYANIPEETFWYDLRINQDGWKPMTYVLLIGHLFIPFFLLMGRTLRRNKILLACSAVLILCMHWLDHYWLVMPQFQPEANTFTFAGMGMLADIACGIGMIAVFIALFCLIARNRPLVALKDPRLGEALNHEVH